MPENVVVPLLPPNHREVVVHRYRYEVASRFAFGRVVDAACGWGYGSAMLADAANVVSVTGVDRDETAIWHARKLYEKPTFEVADLAEGLPVNAGEFDTLVSLETLEHLPRPKRLIAHPGLRRIIASAPIVPTVGHNPYHLHDFTRNSFVAMFGPDWRVIHEERQGDLYLIAVFERPIRPHDS